MTSIRTVRPGIGHPLRLDELSVGDLECVRLMLRGGSVIDWHKLHFRDHADVDRFLRINEYNPDSDDEMARLEELRGEAVDYLTRVFNMSIPDQVADVMAARDLFLVSANAGKNRRWACVVLKVMHIINHLAGREAIVRLPIADDALFRAAEFKVIQVVEELRASGHPITEFAWSRKQRDSLITKLLAKRSTLAAKVYDKLRFRLTVDKYRDLMPILAALTRQLIPFNYVIPGESVNDLLAFEDELVSSPRLAPLGSELQSEAPIDASDDTRPIQNQFSGPDYRIINFVTDLPLRLESLVPPEQLQFDWGHVGFVLAEFQLVDKLTAYSNEQGENNHKRYKQRQHNRVEARLTYDPSAPPQPTLTPTDP